MESMAVANTPEGKPYLVDQKLDDEIGFNITHDSALISMAFAPGAYNPPAFSIGIDVMKTQLPARDTVDSFIAMFEGQLTDLEKAQLTPDLPAEERIRRFYWMWTVKEAYTKALGLGLGYDFSRVEFDAVRREIRIDSQAPKGWRFTLFTTSDGADLYEGVVSEFIGGDLAEIRDQASKDTTSWMSILDAATVLERAVDELPSIL